MGGGRARVAGTWKDLTDSVNAMASNLTAQLRQHRRFTTAVARGACRKITVDVKGEILSSRKRLTRWWTSERIPSEVTGWRASRNRRKARRPAQVQGVAGTWKDLTDNVNSMANNLTAQVRNIADVTTAVKKGDLSRKITVDVRGEILELKNTINTMVDQLNGFASEVTLVRARSARKASSVASPGAGVAGTWKDLTDNVNRWRTI